MNTGLTLCFQKRKWWDFLLPIPLFKKYIFVSQHKSAEREIILKKNTNKAQNLNKNGKGLPLILAHLKNKTKQGNPPPKKIPPPKWKKNKQKPQLKPHNYYCQSLFYISYTAKNQNNFPETHWQCYYTTWSENGTECYSCGIDKSETRIKKASAFQIR